MPFPGDILQLHNKSESPIALQWDGRKTVVPPSKVGYVTFEQAVHEFGHPSSTSKELKLSDPFGNWHMVPLRSDEDRRVSSKRGWTLGPTDPLSSGLNPVPDFELSDQEGNKIWTV